MPTFEEVKVVLFVQVGLSGVETLHWELYITVNMRTQEQVLAPEGG